VKNPSPKYNVVAISNSVLLPECTYNTEVSSTVGVEAISDAVGRNEKLLVVTRNPETGKAKDNLNTVSSAALSPVGTVCSVKSFISNGKSGAKISLVGLHRAVIEDIEDIEGGSQIASVVEYPHADDFSVESKRMVEQVKRLFRDIIKLDPRHVAANAIAQAGMNSHPARTCDFIANICLGRTDDRLAVLSALVLEDRLALLCELLEREIEVIKMSRKISSKVKTNIDKHQKEYFLREQMRVIEEELGDDNENE
jgi:ATP-dependent Lon protease